ncbi:ribosome silencing factor [bacterium]|nr:ribosome silencing factor [bacterium]
MDTQPTLDLIVQAALDLKACDLMEIDMEGRSSLSEYVILCHGTSSAHAQGISDKISLTMKKEKILPLGVEGYNEGEWILLDYNSVIVHIFLEETRELYNFEQLFQDFPIRKPE